MTQTPTISQPAPKQAMSQAKEQAQPQYEITSDDKARMQAISDAWDAYNGLLAPPLQKTPGGVDPNVMSNRCAPIVDRGIDFLFGLEIAISVEKGAPDAAQPLLDATWGRKETRLPLLQKLAMNGAIAGQAFLRIVPGSNGTFRLVDIDPSTVCVQTAPQDCETVMLYCIEYSAGEKRNGSPVQVFYREEITRVDPDGNALLDVPDTDATWSIQHWSRVGQHGAWTAAGDPIAWNYEFPPLFSCQNLPNPNSFWGKPDITPDLIAVNRALNLTQSCINLVQVLYGHPILFSNGTGDQTIDIRPGRIVSLPTLESKINAVTLVSDTANALSFAADLRSDIDEQSSTPGVATGRIDTMPRGGLSGIAIELLFMPLLKKTQKKQCSYGELLIDVSQALLVLAHMSGDIDVELSWEDPLPHDDLPSIQASIALKEIGVSNTTIMRNLGFDPEAEQLQSDLEDQAKLVKAQTMMAATAGTLPPGVPPVPVLPGQAYPAPPAAAAAPAKPAESPFIGGH